VLGADTEHGAGCRAGWWAICLKPSLGPILDGKFAGLILAHQHAALGGSMMAVLARQLQQVAFIAHHPVQADHALLLQLERVVQLPLRRPRAMEGRLRRHSPREAPVVIGQRSPWPASVPNIALLVELTVVAVWLFQCRRGWITATVPRLYAFVTISAEA
jgi:hypothetical protein